MNNVEFKMAGTVRQRIPAIKELETHPWPEVGTAIYLKGSKRAYLNGCQIGEICTEGNFVGLLGPADTQYGIPHYTMGVEVRLLTVVIAGMMYNNNDKTTTLIIPGQGTTNNPGFM